VHWSPNTKLYPPYLRARIKQGKGVGKGAEYRPWLAVSDVPSEGTSSQISGILIDRPFDLLSELEATYFFLVERKRSTVDIRECWPILDIDRTLELCARLGVRHQYGGHYPAPFTIDFLITELIDGQLQYRAASIKTPEDATDPEVRRRLSVEYLWCRDRGIPWKLVDTSKFDRKLLSTLRFMRTWFRHRYEPDKDSEDKFIECFRTAYSRNVPLARLIERVAKALHVTNAHAQDIFRYCVWTDGIATSLKHPLALNLPLVLRRMDDAA
jgi:hypothetical protein